MKHEERRTKRRMAIDAREKRNERKWRVGEKVQDEKRTQGWEL